MLRKILRSMRCAKFRQLSFFLFLFSSISGTKSEKFTFARGSSRNCYFVVLNISVDSFHIRPEPSTLLLAFGAHDYILPIRDCCGVNTMSCELIFFDILFWLDLGGNLAFEAVLELTILGFHPE